MSCFDSPFCTVSSTTQFHKLLYRGLACGGAALLCLLALGLGTAGHASAEETTPGAELEPITPHIDDFELPAEVDESRQIWVTPGDAMGEPGTEVIIEHQDRYPTTQPIVWTCHIASEAVFRDTEVRLEIRDREDAPVLRGAVSFQRREGRNTSRFRWDPRYLEPGVYTARVTLAPRPGCCGFLLF